MSEAPERIWLQVGSLGLDDTWYCQPYFDSDTEYTRSDLCDRDAIRAEAFEEAASMASDCAKDYGKPPFEMLARKLRAKATRGLALAEHARLSGELLGSEGGER